MPSGFSGRAGASITIFHRDGEVRISVTFMTGTLAKLGHRFAVRHWAVARLPGIHTCCFG